MDKATTSIQNTGTSTTFQRPDPISGVVIDSHMHIQSGACAPLPVLWTSVPQFHRKTLEKLAWFVVHKASDVQGKATDVIGERIARESADAFVEIRKQSPIYTANPGQRFLAPLIVMPMDMEYAHIAGYPTDGKPSPLYHVGQHRYEELLPTEMGAIPIERVATVWYFERSNGLDAEENGRFVDLSHEMPEGVWLYENFSTQMRRTIAAATRHPFRLIPMFHYDPRRWSQESGTTDDFGAPQGKWDTPFKWVATKETSGVCIGFKVYPPLGYRPRDRRLPLLDEFYRKCISLDVPVLTHCSPGGVTAADWTHYIEKDLADIPTKRKASYETDSPKGYFFDHYVHPQNWEEVLKDYGDLRLCLAHFGGDEWKASASAYRVPDLPPGYIPPDPGYGYESMPMKIEKTVRITGWIQKMIDLACNYPNVYIDISCFYLRKEDGGIDPAVRIGLQDVLQKIKSGADAQYVKLKTKILFGTDWYLTLIASPKLRASPTYRKTCEDYFTAFAEIDDKLWHQFSYLNPMKFYRLDEPKVLSNMYEALKARAEKEPDRKDLMKRLEENYEQMKALELYTKRVKRDLGG